MTHSNLERFAVGQKLTNASSVLIDYLTPLGKEETQSIPVSIVAEEFAVLLEMYENNKADLLLDSPERFLLEAHPLSFVPLGDEIKVAGTIDEPVLSVMEKLHELDAETVIRNHITKSVTIINPDNQVEIKELSLFEQVEALADRVQQHAKEIEKLDTEAVEDDVLEFIEDGEMVEEDETFEIETIPHKEEAIKEVERIDIKPKKEPVTSYIGVDDKSVQEVEQPVQAEVATEIAKDEPVEEIAQDKPVEEDVISSDVLKNVYNSLIQSIKDKGIEERVSFDQPLMFAR